MFQEKPQGLLDYYVYSDVYKQVGKSMLLNYYVVRIYVVASSCLELRSFLACKKLSTLKSFELFAYGR